MEENALVDEAEEDEKRAFDENRLASILESVLFATGEPIPLRRLVEILEGPSPAEVRGALRALSERLESSGRGVCLAEVAGGYQLRTTRENAEWVRTAFRDKPRRLGRAALETLAVIAYRQPVTRAEIEAIRGVDIEAVVTTLLQRGVVKVAGRKESVGRPILYGTSEVFLELFGFRDLSELPKLKELPQAAEVNQDEQTEPASNPGDSGEAGEGSQEVAASGSAAESPGADAAGVQAGAPAEADGASGDSLAPQGGGADPRGSSPSQ